VGLTLELVNISKSYNGNQVIRDCSYIFPGGGSYIIMGPNGSGKSTLFRIAALLEAPEQGQVVYRQNGQPLAPDINLKRRITMVFPRLGIFNRSVFANVAYGLKFRGLPRKLRGQKVMEVLAQVGLTHKAPQPALTLSSGETMRLGLARALALDPEVLFLDEPTAHIDQANTDIIEACIHRIRTERALTLFIITHDPAQAERLQGQKLLLQDGGLVAC